MAERTRLQIQVAEISFLWGGGGAGEGTLIIRVRGGVGWSRCSSASRGTSRGGSCNCFRWRGAPGMAHQQESPGVPPGLEEEMDERTQPRVIKCRVDLQIFSALKSSCIYSQKQQKLWKSQTVPKWHVTESNSWVGNPFDWWATIDFFEILKFDKLKMKNKKFFF